MVSCAFFQARIDAIEKQIVDIETAIDGLISGAILMYELDTGQTRTRVTKMNISALYRMIDSLMERLFRYEQRKNGGGTIIAGPALGT